MRLKLGARAFQRALLDMPPALQDSDRPAADADDAFGKIASPPMKRRFSHQRLQRHAPRVDELRRLARDRSLTPAETTELQQELANVFSAAEKAEVDVLGAAKVLRLCDSDSPKGKRLQRLRDQARHCVIQFSQCTNCRPIRSSQADLPAEPAAAAATAHIEPTTRTMSMLPKADLTMSESESFWLNRRTTFFFYGSGLIPAGAPVWLAAGIQRALWQQNQRLGPPAVVHQRQLE